MSYAVIYTKLNPAALAEHLIGFKVRVDLARKYDRQIYLLKCGEPIRNPVCFRQNERLECIDRLSRMWFAKEAGIDLPVFISDYDGIWEGEHIDRPEDALRFILDPPLWGPYFTLDGLRYRAP